MAGSPTYVTNPGALMGKPGMLQGSSGAAGGSGSASAGGGVASEAGSTGGGSSTLQYSHFAVPGVNMGYGQPSVHGPPPPVPSGQPPPIMARHNSKWG